MPRVPRTRLTSEADVRALPTAKIESTLAQFDGEIEQRPPMFSAIKIDGERSYAKARRGEHVEMPLRTVRIDECVLQERLEDELTVLVKCERDVYPLDCPRPWRNVGGRRRAGRATARVRRCVIACGGDFAR